MKRLTWFLAMTIPTLAFMGLSLLLQKILVIGTLQTFLGLMMTSIWLIYVIFVWTIPDRDGGFTK